MEMNQQARPPRVPGVLEKLAGCCAALFPVRGGTMSAGWQVGLLSWLAALGLGCTWLRPSAQRAKIRKFQKCQMYDCTPRYSMTWLETWSPSFLTR
jgi:hypothetical protein